MVKPHLFIVCFKSTKRLIACALILLKAYIPYFIGSREENHCAQQRCHDPICEGILSQKPACRNKSGKCERDHKGQDNINELAVYAHRVFGEV
jgi:hypothetical protein